MIPDLITLGLPDIMAAVVPEYVERGIVTKAGRNQVPPMHIGEQDERLAWLRSLDHPTAVPASVRDDISQARILLLGDDPVRGGV